MKILALGDSFTYGEELADRRLAWPMLLAARLNATVTNLGAPAASNDKIVRSLLEHTLDNTPDLVVIGWSSPGRMEFADDLGYYDIWPGYSGNLFIKDGMYWRKELVEYVSRHHRDEFFHRRFLGQVLLVQSYLKTRGINYLMLNVVNNEHYLKTKFESLNGYISQIDTTKYIDFGSGGMLEWTYGCKLGPGGHFLEDGHAIVANKVYEHFRNFSGIT